MEEYENQHHNHYNNHHHHQNNHYYHHHQHADDAVVAEVDLIPNNDNVNNNNYTYFFEFFDLNTDLVKHLKVGSIAINNGNGKGKVNGLHPPLTGRLRYICFDVSPKVTPVLESPSSYLALGTTSGSVHIFQHCRLDDLPPQEASKVKTTTTSNPLILQQSQIDSICSLVTNDDVTLNSTSLLTTKQSQYRKVSPVINHHLFKIIHEDLISPITSLAFAPVQLLLNQPTKSDSVNTSQESTSGRSSSSSSLSSSSSTTSSIDHYPCHQIINKHNYGHSGRSASQHQLANILLAIGTSKGNILIVDINLRRLAAISNSEHHQRSKSSTSTSSSFLKLRNSNQFSQIQKLWSIVYQNSSFSRDSITLLRWDNINRLVLFILFS